MALLAQAIPGLEKQALCRKQTGICAQDKDPRTHAKVPMEERARGKRPG
jgi:hypothetical protein